MARQITEESVNAFLKGETFSKQNMTVTTHVEYIYLMLHGNVIARRPVGAGLYQTEITNAGWESNTTKERLHYLLIEVTAGTWRLSGAGGQWHFWSKNHGEEPQMPLDEFVKISDLMALEVQIASEREHRQAERNVAARMGSAINGAMAGVGLS